MLAARHDDDYLGCGGVKRVIYVFVSTLKFFFFSFLFLQERTFFTEAKYSTLLWE